ncbi:zinc finger protein OZF-like [Teleopsis dalmanni]|uniref:zinc finger protein OZF-like n=1 Tax=Teleopsis dalmanni TaxID=139649 RepID=UPI0018CE80DB|nr:zinc finger protein OZF-like [Teleopsis dalmanni]
MLKIVIPEVNAFHNLKCGEIFCLTSTVYKAACCLCGQHIDFSDFPQHFQEEHLVSTIDSKDIKETAQNFEKQVETTKIEPIELKDKSPQNECESLETAELNVDEEFQTVLESVTTQEEDENPINIEELLLEVESVVKSIDIKETEVISESHISADEEDTNWNDENLDETSETDDSKTNDSDVQFSCRLCTRKYKHKRSLYNHMRINHNPSRPRILPKFKFKCGECGESFRTERNLRGHKWKHTGIVCDICGKSFTQTGNLQRHKIRHTGIKAYKCDECDSSFFTDKELRSHIMRHTGFMPVICEICGRKCRDRGVLKAHMRRHTGERPAKCTTCGKCFFSVHDLTVHAVSHTKERPFVCDVCSATFQRKKALRVHKRIHLKDKRYKCKICDKAYAQSGGLRFHMRSHGTEPTKNINSIEDIITVIPVNSIEIGLEGS